MKEEACEISVSRYAALSFVQGWCALAHLSVRLPQRVFLHCSAPHALSQNRDDASAEALNSSIRSGVESRTSVGPALVLDPDSYTHSTLNPSWLLLPPVAEVTSRVLNCLGCKDGNGRRQDVLTKLVEGHKDDACMPDLDMLVLHIHADDLEAADGVILVYLK
jgi:hypothetical protein